MRWRPGNLIPSDSLSVQHPHGSEKGGLLHFIDLVQSRRIVAPIPAARAQIDSFRKIAVGVVWSTPSLVRTTVLISLSDRIWARSNRSVTICPTVVYQRRLNTPR